MVVLIDLAILVALFYWMRGAWGGAVKNSGSGADGVAPSSDFMNPEAPPLSVVAKPPSADVIFGGERPAQVWDAESLRQHDVTIRFADVPDSYVTVAGGRLYANMKLPGPMCAFKIEQIPGARDALVSIRAVSDENQRFVGVDQSGSLILLYTPTHFLMGKVSDGDDEAAVLWTLRAVTLKTLVERANVEPFHLRVGGDRVGVSTTMVMEPYVDATVPDGEMIRDVGPEVVRVVGML